MIPNALKELRLRKEHKFCALGELSMEVEWGYYDVVRELEEKRKQRSQVSYDRKKAAEELTGCLFNLSWKLATRMDAESTSIEASSPTNKTNQSQLETNSALLKITFTTSNPLKLSKESYTHPREIQTLRKLSSRRYHKTASTSRDRGNSAIITLRTDSSPHRRSYSTNPTTKYHRIKTSSEETFKKNITFRLEGQEASRGSPLPPRHPVQEHYSRRQDDSYPRERSSLS